MKSFLKTASRAVAALFAVALVTMGVASPAFADDGTGTVTTGSITIEHDGQPTGVTYNDIKTATTAAKSGDTIKLGKGNYTLYGVDSAGTTKGKDLTFEGLGTDKTAWNIGAEVPNPDNFGTEYNGDYSFDGASSVTFENMTMRSGSADYLGFIRANKTVLNDCVVNGKTFYWGYESAEFNNTTFNAPGEDYSLWTYSSPTMTFNKCTFNCAGKAINVYTDYSAGTHDIIVNVNSCTFNSTAPAMTALKINDKNMGGFKYEVNIDKVIIDNVKTTATGLETDPYTCSKVFGFGGYVGLWKGYNSGRTDVTIEGAKVWSGGKMLTHDYTDGEHEKDGFKVTYTEWATDNAGTWTRTGTPKCKYCGFTKPEFEEKAYDLSYDLNGSEDKQTGDFAKVEHIAKTKVTADKPARKGYSFAGWNTAADGSGTSYEAGADIVLEAPVTLYAQWKKDEPAPKPSDNKPAGKPANKTKANKQDLPNTGDASANIVAAMGIMAIACFVASAVVSKIRK
ncbi:InlB B-repeat-containing protein [Collinsella sp. Sow4_D11]|uniref:InlB B-repeat-containing protein n=1 Tax=Collinsella sp. Sow4_D11 TaxID=3438775 RepID=UPI003F8EDAAC